jgi:enoyl-CoA hydratase/carnithine racemase
MHLRPVYGNTVLALELKYGDQTRPAWPAHRDRFNRQRTRLNAMTRQMLSKLGALWDELEHDPACRCIILTGVGERAFTVGADISGDLAAGHETARVVNHALLKNDAYSKPVVAAVNGDCVGGGLELLLSTDIRATVREARFGLPEVKWSIYPFGGSTIKLIQQIGYVHAMD